MMMKAQTPAARSRHVVAHAEGSKDRSRKVSATILGAAMQFAVLGSPASYAAPVPVDQPKVIEQVMPASSQVRQVREQALVADAQAGVLEASTRSGQEKMKADEIEEKISQASSEMEVKAAELAKQAAEAKYAAEEATKAKLVAATEASGAVGAAKENANMVLAEKTKMEKEALQKAADAKTAAENAIAEMVAR